jgi:hypothetical protein
MKKEKYYTMGHGKNQECRHKFCSGSNSLDLLEDIKDRKSARKQESRHGFGLTNCSCPLKQSALWRFALGLSSCCSQPWSTLAKKLE